MTVKIVSKNGWRLRDNVEEVACMENDFSHLLLTFGGDSLQKVGFNLEPTDTVYICNNEGKTVETIHGHHFHVPVVEETI